MYAKDFTNYQFHPSNMAGLVDTFIKNHYSNPLTEKQRADYENCIKENKTHLKKFKELQEKIDKKANKRHLELEQSTKTTLYDIWLKEAVNVSNFVSSQETFIGNKYEQASIDLINGIYKQGFVKNEKTFYNDYFCGTPDIIGTQSILDVKTKTRFDLFDKASQSEADFYFWQLWTYKQLTNKDRLFIAFALPSISDDDIFLEQQKKTKGVSDPDLIKKIQDQIFNNMNFDRIPGKARVKMFEVKSLKLKDGTEKLIDEIEPGLVCEYLEQCRVYLNGITNNNLQYFK